MNLASRLEGLCPQYGADVVVSGETRAGCGENFVFQYLDTLRVKGRAQPVSVYIPLRPEEASGRAEEMAARNSACALYREGDFAKAAASLTALRGQFPDRKAYAVYAERARKLRDDPPASWDGVWTLTSK